jgi:hypothetical protein
MADKTTIDSDLANALTGYSVKSINGNNVGNTTVFTTAGNPFIPTQIDIILTAVSGLGTPPVINLGWTSATFSDFINGQALANNLTTQGDVFRCAMPATNMVPFPANTAIVVRVATAALVTTTYTMEVVIRGYYQP